MNGIVKSQGTNDFFQFGTIITTQIQVQKLETISLFLANQRENFMIKFCPWQNYKDS